jgi:hypothetical protein
MSYADMDDISKWISDRTKDATGRLKFNKKLIFSILEKNKINTLCVDFDGGGDSGSVTEMVFDPPKDSLLKEDVIGAKILKQYEYTSKGSKQILEDEDCTVGDLIHCICYDILESRHIGWETNDGAFGSFKFDVKNKNIVFSFNERYTDVRPYEDENI